MGKRGPAPKPTAIKQLEGTYRPDRAAANEPMPPVVMPTAPHWLTAVAKWEFERLAKQLVELRVMTEVDRTALAAYAQQYSIWREAEQMLKEQGRVLVSEKGGAYLNPWQGVANMAFKQMVKLMQEFGLTPASRTRVNAQPESEDEDLATILFNAVKQGGA